MHEGRRGELPGEVPGHRTRRSPTVGGTAGPPARRAMVEASDTETLSERMRGFAIRITRAINRCLGRREQLIAERYHARELKTPREVRNALVYILRNNLHHGDREDRRLPSAPWFDGFRAPFAPRGRIRPRRGRGPGWRRWAGDAAG